MKKIILSIAALLATSSVFAQTFVNGSETFTESFGGSGTSCLKNFSNGGLYAYDGNVVAISNDANAISLTAKASALSAGVAMSLSDIYYTNGLNCNPMRGDNVGVDLSSNPVILVRAKASVDGATAQFHVASSPSGYPASGYTSASILVPTAQTEKTLTTSYQDFIIDYSGTQWTGSASAFQTEINMFGLIIPSDNVLNAGVVIMVEKIVLGATVTGNTSANVVNDQVAIAPNPAQGSFNVDMSAMQNSESASVKVLNANGLVVKEFTTNSDQERITTDGMNKGIYMVRITSGNKVATKKVVVE